MRADWLGDVLVDEGLRVVTAGSPLGRGREMSSIKGVVDHDTVTPDTWSDMDVASLLIQGRAGLPGPLSQLGVDRAERVWWIADGRCNHNGYGRWGNNAIGIEVFCAGGLAGREEPQTPGQRETVARASAAILRHLGLPASRLQGHWEQDGRKIDPFDVDMVAMRARTFDLYAPGSDSEEQDMGKIVRERENPATMWFTTGAQSVRMRSGDHVRQYAYAGLFANFDEWLAEQRGGPQLPLLDREFLDAVRVA